MALSEEQKRSLIADIPGFISSKAQPGFARYAEKVLLAPADNNSTYSDENRIAARMLQQEVIASTAAQLSMSMSMSRSDTGSDDSNSVDNRHNNSSGSGRLVVLWLDKRDAIFGLGVQERVRRNLQARLQQQPANTYSPEVYSVLLNPTARDSLSDTVQLRLCLAYTPTLQQASGEQQRPLVDFIWFGPFSPPASRLLPRVKNPISREGDKPPGESSILRAF